MINRIFFVSLLGVLLLASCYPKHDVNLSFSVDNYEASISSGKHNEDDYLTVWPYYRNDTSLSIPGTMVQIAARLLNIEDSVLVFFNEDKQRVLPMYHFLLRSADGSSLGSPSKFVPLMIKEMLSRELIVLDTSSIPVQYLCFSSASMVSNVQNNNLYSEESHPMSSTSDSVTQVNSFSQSNDYSLNTIASICRHRYQMPVVPMPGLDTSMIIALPENLRFLDDSLSVIDLLSSVGLSLSLADDGSVLQTVTVNRHRGKY